MKRISDWVLDAALDYEQAILEAQQALDGGDDGVRRAACKRLAEAQAVFQTMYDDERQSAVQELLYRGHLPDDEQWNRIDTALHHFLSGTVGQASQPAYS